MANESVKDQFHHLKRVFLNQDGGEKSRRHLKTRDKYFAFARRRRFRWERRTDSAKGVVSWRLWMTTKDSGKKDFGVEVKIPLGKICAEGWPFAANELRKAKKEVRNDQPK